MAISVASRKAKGRKLQQLICEEFSKLVGIKWGSDEAIASREMGQSGTDIRLIGDALKIIKLSVECKAQESWSVHSWIDQAKENKLPGTDWILIAKSKRNKPIMFMDFEAFLKMFKTVVEERMNKLNLEKGECGKAVKPKPSRLVKRK